MGGLITVVAITGLVLIYLINIPDPKNKNSNNKLKH